MALDNAARPVASRTNLAAGRDVIVELHAHQRVGDRLGHLVACGGRVKASVQPDSYSCCYSFYLMNMLLLYIRQTNLVLPWACNIQLQIIEDKHLARSMADSVVVDRGIPPQFYKAVAEIIHILYAKILRKASAK